MFTPKRWKSWGLAGAGGISQLQVQQHMEFIHSHPQEWLCLVSSAVGAGLRGSTAWEAPLFPVFLGSVAVPVSVLWDRRSRRAVTPSLHPVVVCE